MTVNVYGDLYRVMAHLVVSGARPDQRGSSASAYLEKSAAFTFVSSSDLKVELRTIDLLLKDASR